MGTRDRPTKTAVPKAANARKSSIPSTSFSQGISGSRWKKKTNNAQNNKMLDSSPPNNPNAANAKRVRVLSKVEKLRPNKVVAILPPSVSGKVVDQSQRKISDCVNEESKSDLNMDTKNNQTHFLMVVNLKHSI